MESFIRVQCSPCRLGQSIGRHPGRYIAGCLLVVGLCGLGLLRFTEVTDPDKLWVPDDADVLTQKAWIEENFPSTTRIGFLIGVSGNVLTPGGLGAVRVRFRLGDLAHSRCWRPSDAASVKGIDK